MRVLVHTPAHVPFHIPDHIPVIAERLHVVPPRGPAVRRCGANPRGLTESSIAVFSPT
ncbi:hypothetical protein DA2_2372 [Desulfovibrio sp. A2]|nr:hypothetical protein DA2_2372 [Desulfovibrio sp. A2]